MELERRKEERKKERRKEEKRRVRDEEEECGREAVSPFRLTATPTLAAQHEASSAGPPGERGGPGDRTLKLILLLLAASVLEHISGHRASRVEYKEHS